MSQTLLEVRDLKKYFPARKDVLGRPKSYVHAVDGVSFSVEDNSIFAVVGESGCGKSTTGRLLMKLTDPDAGQIKFKGQDVTRLKARDVRAFTKDVQMIFQDPYASLNPRMTVAELVAEPLIIHGLGNSERRTKRVDDLLDLVGLRPSQRERYPHEFSGGQRQRIGIAKALAVDPALVIADEPVSALDVSIQSQILNLLTTLRSELGMSYVFISHDLSVVEHMSDYVAVMYLGELVEVARKEELFKSAKHPYTEALMSAIPVTNPKESRERVILRGDVPDPTHPPGGCRFHTRCPYVMERCKEEVPLFRSLPDGRRVACHLY